MKPNTTYALTGWGEVNGASDRLEIGVKNYGGSQLSAPVTDTTWTYDGTTSSTAGFWQQQSLDFTTGSGETTATVFCYHDEGSDPAYCDDFSVIPVGTQTVTNGGFETGSLTPWTGNGDALVTTPTHTGTYALSVNGAGSTAQQIITLQPNTTYQLTGWGEVGTSGDHVELGVKNYGGSQIGTPITATTWTEGALSFTTGSTDTSATIFCYHDTGSADAYCDDISVTPVP